ARTLSTGTYDVREVVATSSPSMDIQVSSNFERLLFEATGRDAAQVRAYMASLAQSGRFSLSSEALSRIRALFNADRADEEETAATIRTALRETLRLIDPHTAVGLPVACARPCQTGFPTYLNGLSGRPRCRSIKRQSKNSSWRQAVPRVKEPRHERGSHSPPHRFDGR